MDVFVVVDMLGDGRIVGVFSTEAAARQVIGEFGEYYKLRRCALDQVDPSVIGWARSDEQRAWLEQFIGRPVGG